ncbi:MAG: hypothetical protein IH987_06265 [Planctomycetes bacterium]|nr:hypothetical protein [Planctomycetota bacterium]
MSKNAKKSEERLFPEPLQPGVVLTDAQIRELVRANQLFDPRTWDERGLDCCSYDVRIGRKGIVGGRGVESDLTAEALEISPGGYAAVISEECVKIPADLLVRINSKRSFSYEGIALLTGTQIDPGYTGHLLFGFYNASARKVILRRGRPICSLVFESLGGQVSRPKSPDPDLLRGNFPDRFVNEMANKEVLSWAALSEHVKEIDRITKDILDLRTKYEDVVEPIKQLTGNVEKLSQDVDKLSISIGVVSDQVSKLEIATSSNAQHVNEISASVKVLVGEISHVKEETGRLGDVDRDQQDKIGKLSSKFSVFSILVYVFWAVLLVVAGGLLTTYVLPRLLS